MLSDRPGTNNGSARASTRSTPCSAASTGATTSSGCSTAPRPEPFYRAIARDDDAFVVEDVGLVRRPTTYRDIAGHGIGPGRAAAQPADLLREVHRAQPARGHRLLLFDSMDAMVRAWGATRTRDFFARCCPMLLEFGAIAYWSMTRARRPPRSRTPCTP